MNGEQEVMFRMSVNNVNRIVNVLSQGRYDQVYDLIASLRDQAIAQLSQPSPNQQMSLNFPSEELETE